MAAPTDRTDPMLLASRLLPDLRVVGGEILVVIGEVPGWGEVVVSLSAMVRVLHEGKDAGQP